MAKILWLGMLAITLAFGMAVTGCGTSGAAPQRFENPNPNGRWLDDEGFEFRFSNGDWEIWYGIEPLMRGTYTTRDGVTIIMVTTHIHSFFIAEILEGMLFVPVSLDPAWYSRDEIIPTMTSVIINALVAIIEEEGQLSPADMAEFFEIVELFEEEAEMLVTNYLGEYLYGIFPTFTKTFSVDGDVLTMTLEGEEMTLTRIREPLNN